MYVLYLYTHAYINYTHHIYVGREPQASYFMHIIPVFLCISVGTKYMILQCTRMYPCFMLTLTSLHPLQIPAFSTNFSKAIEKGTSKFTYLLSITDASLHKSLGKLMRFYLT